MASISFKTRFGSLVFFFVLLLSVNYPVTRSVPTEGNRKFWRPKTLFRSRGEQTKGKGDQRHNPLFRMFKRKGNKDTSKNSDTETMSDDENQTPTTDTTSLGEEPEDLTSSSDEEVEDEDGEMSADKLKLLSQKEKRRRFLDHIALVSSSFLNKERAARLDKEEEEDFPLHKADQVTPQTDLTLPGRHFHIVTTAALPWFTGTAVNPLLRAAYLHRRTQQINSNEVDVQVQFHLEDGTTELTYNTSNPNTTRKVITGNKTDPTHHQWVTLVIPWLELDEDQLELYGQVFPNQQAQEDYIRKWLAEDAGMPDAADPRTGLKLLFYPARYHSGLRSIFAMGDINQLITGPVDVCILEEPEHCNWYRAPGDGWTQKFHYVVGIVHTNYKEYASAHYSGLWTAPAIAMISSAMVRAYCHQVIKLSDVLQTFAPEKEATSNVHGVRSAFLEIGLERARELNGKGSTTSSSDTEDSDSDGNATSVYFIGKLLWAKGLDLLLDLEDYYKSCTGDYFPIDIYGNGPEQKAIHRAYWGRKLVSKNNNTQHSPSNENSKRHRSKYSKLEKRNATKTFTSKTAFKEHLQKFKDSLPTKEDNWRKMKESITSAKESMAEFPNTFADSLSELPTTFAEWRQNPVPATFPGRVDHGSLGRHAKQYKVFVNPSISEVLCTTTAEALAMGKFAIIPVHPSNTFFLRFPNCLAYRNKFEFVANLQWALTHDPEPLTPELAHEFTWEAATDRLIEASAVTWKESREREKLGYTKRDERIAWFFNEMGKGTKGDIIRMILGGGPASAQVKYVLQQQKKPDDESGEEDEDDEVEDEGLTQKFHQSSFVQALRATVASGLPSNILGNADP